MIHQHLPEPVQAIDAGAIGVDAGAVNRLEVLVVVPVSPDHVEALEGEPDRVHQFVA